MRRISEATVPFLNPVRMFLTVLAIIFVGETSIMILIPVILPSAPEPLVAVADSFFLTLMASPLLWWVIIRPLRSLALAEHARAASIVDTAADGIISIDEQGLILSFNPAAEEIFDYRADEVVGQPASMLVRAQPGASSDADVRRAPDLVELPADGRNVEVRGFRKGGQELPLALSVSEFRLAKRRAGTWIVRDLTERKRYERQQHEREVVRSEHMAAIAQMATGVAHELRNPLTSVKMLVQGSRKQAAGLSSADLEIMEQEIHRMERCVQSYLDYARPPKPERRQVDLVTLIERTFALVNRRATQQQVALRFTRPPTPVEVNADWDQMQQLLLNLALNALDMLPQGGAVEFSLVVGTDGQVELRVFDTGPGIAPDLLPRLFEPFVTSKATGVGLGLVVSRRIAEDHGGTLTAGNRPEGGACFVLRIPTPNFASKSPV
ncbi:MAG: PAS domain S-box protein [Planctomycetales bacterium]|nr:PAS domain S-box protein [Planctomycetales bacterium]